MTTPSDTPLTDAAATPKEFELYAEQLRRVVDLSRAFERQLTKARQELAEAREKAAIVIDMVGGFCPCQAEGTFYGMPFYFRARHGAWTLEIANPGEDPVSNGSFLFAEGDDPNGGFMPQEEAIAAIGKVFAEQFWPKYYESRSALKDKPLTAEN